MRIGRGVAWCAAALFGMVVAARFLFGPYSFFGIPVTTSLNPGGVFGLIVTALMVTRPIESSNEQARLPWPMFAAAGVALLALFPALDLYFLSDDFILVKQARAWTAGALVPLLTTPGGDGFFRPLGYLSLAMDAKLAGTGPEWWHFTAILLHMTNSALVAMLAVRWGASSLTAFVGSAIFALHGTHLEAAAWIAGRFDLLATLFVLATLLLFGRSTIAALACAFAALWSKEAAFILPALIALVAWHERRGWRSTIPFFGVTLAAFLYRWTLLGGIGGYHEQSGGSLFYSLKFASTAKVLFARVWTYLYFPINWSSDPGQWMVPIVLLYVAALLWLAWKTRPGPAARLAFASLILAILPPLHLLSGSPDLSGGRLLYLPSVFFCILLASAAENLRRAQTIAIAAILFTFHAAMLRHDFAFWHSVSDRVETICTEAARNGTPVHDPPHIVHGVPALANGAAECPEIARQ